MTLLVCVQETAGSYPDRGIFNEYFVVFVGFLRRM
jgi:hypothetical protein